MSVHNQAKGTGGDRREELRPGYVEYGAGLL